LIGTFDDKNLLFLLYFQDIHVIPAKAKDLVADAMWASGEWRFAGEATTGVFVKEREHLGVNFRGDIKLTVNQMDPEIAFHSRKWQGHQVSLLQEVKKKYRINLTQFAHVFAKLLKQVQRGESSCHLLLPI